jgi:hypothetical protein
VYLVFIRAGLGLSGSTGVPFLSRSLSRRIPLVGPFGSLPCDLFAVVTSTIPKSPSSSLSSSSDIVKVNLRLAALVCSNRCILLHQPQLGEPIELIPWVVVLELSACNTCDTFPRFFRDVLCLNILASKLSMSLGPVPEFVFSEGVGAGTQLLKDRPLALEFCFLGE